MYSRTQFIGLLSLSVIPLSFHHRCKILLRLCCYTKNLLSPLELICRRAGMAEQEMPIPVLLVLHSTVRFSPQSLEDGEPWKGKGGTILALALSPNGKTIACGREDGSVQRWDTDGKMMKSIWTGHIGGVRSL
ncbi:hypothetical protein K503DRAFT_625639 [Rhizopogon vinicolor AM-OR11-026]|uniref:Uncharacterized protein n=1 Tax=Rhizopogon vinicolor AM-OR11-026 TaxID=1314800 RepID=A0A1B7MI44_9AGAM|nr:hypothetical protein K503DRAFT_625639 [Rhizopogon vinicolor AM-OR11-026]